MMQKYLILKSPLDVRELIRNSDKRDDTPVLIRCVDQEVDNRGGVLLLSSASRTPE